MRFTQVFLCFVFFWVASNALPFWISSVTPADSKVVPPLVRGVSKTVPKKGSGLRWYERPLTAAQIAEKDYKKQRVSDFAESTLTQLFDAHDIVPDEHEWGGSSRPFNPDEYFRLTAPPDKPQTTAWQTVWQGIRELFSSTDAASDIDMGEGPRTTLGTDGTAKTDTESLFDFTENDTGTWHSALENSNPT
ncbi:hypothetical protein L873DRAFT_1816449 [Choiromyces venosus 120613-1]|uniref:Uncharacterized protein n=1 Tax=Choiromyces venosus 120613-1 TaxID=1336337 RepID=A0A3N4J4X4_9PEZI|nr:hypothetical protein L873DRAFT_1816449 [Choiromyces venosus 120613-1]